MSQGFWERLDRLVADSALRIDRPRGSRHPRYPDFRYPYDYGYLAETRSGDGGGVDVWVGTLAEKRVTGIVCTVDLERRDTELKLLLSCSSREAQEILKVHNVGGQAAILVERGA
jgi:inorganic pyrophosphatase